jgi:hypothetical protein
VYDPNIDRFSQYLWRLLVCADTSLENFFATFFPPHLQDQARQLARDLVLQGGVGYVHASIMSPFVLDCMNTLKNYMVALGSYDDGTNATGTASSGDETSSDDDSVLRPMPF